METDFWRLASALLPPEQVARLHRMDQHFQPYAVCQDSPMEMRILGSGLDKYVIFAEDDYVTCSCPDNRLNPDLLCKHLCWVLFRKGNATVADLQNRNNGFEAAIRRAWDVVLDELLLAHSKHACADDVDLEDDCPICYMELAERNECVKCAECRNHFHADCIVEWLHRSPQCPLCRHRDWDHMCLMTRCGGPENVHES